MSIHDLSRREKSALIILTDMFFVVISLWIAFVLRLGTMFWPSPDQLSLFVMAPILAFPIFIKFGLHRSVVRYIGSKGMFAIVQATGLLALSWLLVTTALLPTYLGIDVRFSRHFISETMFPRSIPILYWIILTLTIGGSRQLVCFFLLKATPIQAKRNVLIYGAGRVGLELASSLSHNKDIKVLGFIDDDRSLDQHFIQNLKVLGDRTEIEKIRATTSPLEVLLAAPRMEWEYRKGLLKYLEDKKVAVRTVPSLSDIASGAAKMSDLRQVDIMDLLARKEIAPNHKLLVTCVTNKRIMVTGAGGSIGSELCRQIIALKPLCIVMFDHSEYNLYKINNELFNQCLKENYITKIIPILGSVTNKQLVEETIKTFEINTVYHAAAYKHVTLIEGNIREGVRNNIFGTYNVAQAAYDLNVENFILISTDKAVNPTSVMGATKRITELIIQGLSQKKEIEPEKQQFRRRFVVVRFGNVLGSSGSVIPLFQSQIKSGGPVTITHPEASRYFMTVSEASQLVIQAGSLGTKYGNIFALDMGEPVSILSLAKQLIYLSGYMLRTSESKADELCIEIQYIGLQKGEKVHEELFTGENIANTEHPMIMEAREGFCGWPEVEEMLTKLELRNDHNEDKMRRLLMQTITKRATQNQLDHKVF